MKLIQLHLYFESKYQQKYELSTLLILFRFQY